MIKRIVSGIFALAVLGALGVIIGGALASGEQLIVRFLTAVIVAALALYVVSDLRLKSEPEPGVRSGGQPVRRSSEPATGSFGVSPDSTVPTVPIAADNRDLQPAARTVDVVHPPMPPQTTRIMEEEPLIAASTNVDLESEPALIDLTVDQPTVDKKIPSIPELLDTENPALGDKVEEDAEAIYVAVGTHTYQGNLETPAANWPQLSPEPPAPAPDPTIADGTDDELETADSCDDHQSDDQIAGDDSAVESEQEPQAALAETKPAKVPATQADGTTSVIDLARTTTSYAGPVKTPVIDLREPITEDVPMTVAAVDQPIEQQATQPPMPPEVRTATTITSSPGAADNSPANHNERVVAAIAGGERKVIDTLIRQGMLTTAGPITDRDVRTMVYVAFTSNELRKIIMSRGQVDVDDTSLGPVELFDESVFQPIPQTVYSGRPTELAGPPTPADAGLIAKTRTDDRHGSPV